MAEVTVGAPGPTAHSHSALAGSRPSAGRGLPPPPSGQNRGALLPWRTGWDAKGRARGHLTWHSSLEMAVAGWGRQAGNRRLPRLAKTLGQAEGCRCLLHPRNKPKGQHFGLEAKADPGRSAKTEVPCCFPSRAPTPFAHSWRAGSRAASPGESVTRCVSALAHRPQRHRSPACKKQACLTELKGRVQKPNTGVSETPGRRISIGQSASHWPRGLWAPAASSSSCLGGGGGGSHPSQPQE